ncbi:hypothetical protein FGADI_2623 [Fusarium gaditjirri]|uniref:Uncharacterized protein n=1 Tax=Fusarium gaditjirri TaxID=282569 RepID=A0A8H4X259_9HYPO|nr:hypothetical protein FGADI_2623 [Fusarium gaditjirri]
MPETKVQDLFASPIKDTDVSLSGSASKLPGNCAKTGTNEDKASVNDQPEDNGYVQETIVLNHLKVLWSFIQFLVSYWKVITSVLLTTVVAVICIGICCFEKSNKWLTQNNLPTIPSLQQLNNMVGYTFYVYVTGGSVIFILGHAAWCSIEWKKMVSTETSRFVSFCLGKLTSWRSQILQGIASLFDTLFCRRRYLVILVVAGGGIHWIWERAYPLNAVEQLAAFAERYRDIDIVAFCIFQTGYYVIYYYFACAQYFFPAKYEYKIFQDQVVLYITGSAAVIIVVTLVIGKICDCIMPPANGAQKMEDILRRVDNVERRIEVDEGK